jgi:hypothetical protein
MSNTVAILIIDKSKLVIPIDTHALTVADGPKRKINERYVDSLILYPDGNIFIIKKIDIIGLHGKSFLSKLFSLLNSNWEIEVVKEKVDFTLGDLIQKVISNLNEESLSYFNEKITLDKAIQSLRQVKSIDELFRVLKVDPQGEYLDVL